jgi:TolB protein
VLGIRAHHANYRSRPDDGRRHRAHVRALLSCAAAWLCLAAPAAADVFNGRIAFSSARTDPQAKSFDIFSMNPDGSGVRRLTTNPEGDRQPDWSPDGRAIAYTIDKPDAAKNFEVARMAANGTHVRRLTTTVADQASSQPSWLPDGSGILFRRSGPTGHVASIWQMGLLGENPKLRFATPGPALYPSMSPNSNRVLYTAILSPAGDTDRAIFSQNSDGSGLTALFDVAGTYDSAPAWSPDGTKIAFQSDADVGGANPEHDMEVWVMGADGSAPTQLTHNATHDEGPAWSPDGKLLAYTSGPDNTHGDIRVMTAGGQDLRGLTTYAGADESPDWQAIPAPRTDHRCGDADRSGNGAYDVRLAGAGVTCRQARGLARRWVQAGRPARVRGYAATAKDFGGTRRVELRRRDGGRRTLVAFLYQRSAGR